MALTTKDDRFNYSNITFTASYEDIVGQYYFIINRLLIKLNLFLVNKSAFVDLFYIDVCPVNKIPTLHFVIQRNISNEELDNYFKLWTVEFEKLIQLTGGYEND